MDEHWIFICGIEYDLDDEDPNDVEEILSDLPEHVLLRVDQDGLFEYFEDPEEWVPNIISDHTGWTIQAYDSHRYVGEVDPDEDPDDVYSWLVQQCEGEFNVDDDDE